MIGIVVCLAAKNELEAIAEHKQAALIELCGRTLLERTLDALIAAGVDTVDIFCEKNDEHITHLLKHYDNKDKINIMSSLTDVFAQGEQAIVCSVQSCAMPQVVPLMSKTEANICVVDHNASFVFAKMQIERIKRETLSGKSVDFTIFADGTAYDDVKTVPLKTISSVEDFFACQYELLDGKECKVYNNTCSNFNGVTIIPPVYIGRNVSISDGAVVGKGSVISDGASIGKGARILGSFVGSCAVIGKNCSVESACICSGARLSGRVRVSRHAVVDSRATVKANQMISEKTVVSPQDIKTSEICFYKGEKRLEFDDDCICGLWSGLCDASDYLKLGKAIGTSLHLHDSVVVGFGAFCNMDMLAGVLSYGIRSSGVNVFDIGSCTFPQVGFAVQRTGCELGIFVGVDTNGDIRFVQQNGLPVISQFEDDICDSFDHCLFRQVFTDSFGQCLNAESEKSAYHNSLSSLMPKQLKGLNISVRTNNSIAAKICDSLFANANDLDGERIVFQLSDDLTTVNSYSDKTGNVRWEQLCLLACKIMFEANNAVSLPHNIPYAAEELAKRLQGSVLRYNTVKECGNDAKARETARLPLNAFVRDALRLCVMICKYLNERRISLCEALSGIDSVCCVQRYINDCAADPLFIENAQAVGSEGVRVSDNNTTAFIRRSKNNHSFMIFAESTNTEFASAFCDGLTEKLRK